MRKETASAVTLLPGGRWGAVRIPSSKSAVHRLLICAALGTGETRLELDGLSQDIRATAACLRALGAGIEIGETAIRVRPIEGPVSDAVLPCGESGSTLRFLLPVAGALGATGSFAMEGRLPERPMETYEAVLTAHGMQIRREGSRLVFGGKLESGAYTLPGNVSSQYFSGLLLALPRLAGDSMLRAEGPLESADYIRMTEDALGLAGVRIERPSSAQWSIPGGQRFALPNRLRAEGDWSNAAFFLCMGALSETGVTVEGLNLRSAQGDRAVLELLRQFGANVAINEEAGTVTVRRGEPRPFTVDAGAIPDLVPVLAVLACGAAGETRITHAARLRLKESDRLLSTARLIGDLGGEVEELADGLVIHGTGVLRGGRVDSFNDHRIAMSAAVAACLCSEPVTVEGADCVKKSYPAFWADYERLAR